MRGTHKHLGSKMDADNILQPHARSRVARHNKGLAPLREFVLNKNAFFRRFKFSRQNIKNSIQVQIREKLI